MNMKRKTAGRALALFLCAAMTYTASFAAFPAPAAYAAGEYEVQATDTITELQARVDSGNSLSFPAGTYSYDGALSIGAADITITTASGADVTFTPAAGVSGINVDAAGSVTFAGSGVITMDDKNSTSGNTRGIQCAGAFNMTGGTLNVENSPGYGISGDAVGKDFNMTGGTLNITNCGWIDAEGGFIWDNNVCNFTAGELNITDCGNTSFGSIYVQCPLTFGSNASGAAAMTVNLANKVNDVVDFENTIFISKTMTVNKSATVNVTLTGSGSGQRRGINTAGSDVIIDGGTFNVTNSYTGTGATYGIRGANITVENAGVLDVENTDTGIASRGLSGTLTATADSFVTMNTKTTDNTETMNTITGGSVKMQEAYSVVNGQRVKSDDKIDFFLGDNTPVNASGETLTRFDLSGKANSDIEIAADANDAAAHPAYTYSVGEDHEGTAYVWAPAVTVNFWPSQSDYTTKSNLIESTETIRGNTIAYVGGSAPSIDKVTVPAGQKFLGWINAATGKVFDPDSDVISADTDVYPLFSNVMEQSVPIDLLEDNTNGSSFVNGPLEVSIGDKIYYKATIDMSKIAAIAAGFNTSVGYLTGDYTMTIAATPGLVKAANAGTSADIADYFEGDAVKLFELTGAPTFDSSTNTITFHAKVKDEYKQTGITGVELAKLLNAGLYGVSKGDNTVTVTDAIKAPTYSRAIATFKGVINYSNSTYTKNYSIDMTGTQADPANLSDPTLSDSNYGSAPADTVSATVHYKPSYYNANYTFTSGTDGKVLPDEVLALLPLSAQAADGATVTAVKPTSTTVQVADGTWTFTGYDADSKTINGADVNFLGTWTFTAAGSTDTSTPGTTTGTNTSGKTVTAASGTKTGDSSNIVFYLILLSMAIACASVILTVRRKRAR